MNKTAESLLNALPDAEKAEVLRIDAEIAKVRGALEATGAALVRAELMAEECSTSVEEASKEADRQANRLADALIGGNNGEVKKALQSSEKSFAITDPNVVQQEASFAACDAAARMLGSRMSELEATLKRLSDERAKAITKMLLAAGDRAGVQYVLAARQLIESYERIVGLRLYLEGVVGAKPLELSPIVGCGPLAIPAFHTPSVASAASAFARNGVYHADGAFRVGPHQLIERIRQLLVSEGLKDA